MEEKYEKGELKGEIKLKDKKPTRKEVTWDNESLTYKPINILRDKVKEAGKYFQESNNGTPTWWCYTGSIPEEKKGSTALYEAAEGGGGSEQDTLYIYAKFKYTVGHWEYVKTEPKEEDNDNNEDNNNDEEDDYDEFGDISEWTDITEKREYDDGNKNKDQWEADKTSPTKYITIRTRGAAIYELQPDDPNAYWDEEKKGFYIDVPVKKEDVQPGDWYDEETDTYWRTEQAATSEVHTGYKIYITVEEYILTAIVEEEPWEDITKTISKKFYKAPKILEFKQADKLEYLNYDGTTVTELRYYIGGSISQVIENWEDFLTYGRQWKAWQIQQTVNSPARWYGEYKDGWGEVLSAEGLNNLINELFNIEGASFNPPEYQQGSRVDLLDLFNELAGYVNSG